MKTLITGSSSGIGLACAHKLLSEGHAVIGLSRRPTPIRHADLATYSIDLSDLTNLPKKIDTVLKNVGKII